MKKQLEYIKKLVLKNGEESVGHLNWKGVCEDIDVVISTVGITRQKDGMTYMDVDFQANANLIDEAKRKRSETFYLRFCV